MEDFSNKVYLITPTQPRSVKVSYTLKKVRGIQEQIVTIEEWFQWGQGYLGPEFKNIDSEKMWVECDMSLGSEFEDSVAISYTFDGDNWTEKERHRVQKEYSKGAVNRVIENDNDWHLASAKFYINAPFRVNLIDRPEQPITKRTYVRASKKQLLTRKEQ